MATFKNALTELQEQVELSYVDLEKQGEDLENAIEDFATIAAIKDDVCLGECVTNYNLKPNYVIPALPTPTGTIVWGTATRTTNSITQPFTYTGTDAEYFKSKLDSVSNGNVVSPIVLTGLTSNTPYVISVIPVNQFDIEGTQANTTVTTLATSGGGSGGGSGSGSGGGVGSSEPLGVITFLTPTVSITTILQPFSYSGSDATHFTATLDGVSLGTVVSPIDLTGLVADTAYVIEVTPVNLIGNGTPADTTVTTLEDTAPTGVIYFGDRAVNYNTATILYDVIQNFEYVGSGTVTDFLIELDNIVIGTVANTDNTGIANLPNLAEQTTFVLKVTALNAGVVGVSASISITTPESLFRTRLRNTVYEFYYLYDVADAPLLPDGYLYDAELINNPVGGELPPFNYLDDKRTFTYKIGDLFTATIDLKNSADTTSTYPPSNGSAWLGSPFSRYCSFTLPEVAVNLITDTLIANPTVGIPIHLEPVNLIGGIFSPSAVKPRFVQRIVKTSEGVTTVAHALPYFDPFNDWITGYLYANS